LVLAGRQYDAVSFRDAYGLAHEARNAAGIGPVDEPLIYDSRHGRFLFKCLRRLFGKARRIEGMRPGGDNYSFDEIYRSGPVEQTNLPYL
jgi:hypothetical protein